MERIITLKEINDINTYSTFDSYLVESIFSSYFQYVFKKDELLLLIDKIHSLNKKIYLKADKILIEKEIIQLDDYLEVFNLVDGIFFEDFAFVTYFKNNNIKTDLIYYPFDAIGDIEDIKAILSFNIKKVCVPVGKEYLLYNKDNKEFLGYKKIAVEPLFYTRRKILSLYDGVNDLKIDAEEYNISEKTRTSIQKVLETENGSLILLNEVKVNRSEEYASFVIYDRTFIAEETFINLLKEEEYE